MIAAKVTCLCRQMRLSALGLDLKQGEFGWVPEEKARVSRELKHYEHRGALKVEYLEKVDEMSGYPKWSRGAKVLPQRPGTPAPPTTRASLPGVTPDNAPSLPGFEAEALFETQQDLLQEMRLLRTAFEQRPEPAPVKVTAPPPAAPAKVTVSRPEEETQLLRSLLEEIRALHTVMEGLKGAISALAAHQRNLPATMLGAVQAMSAKMIYQSEAEGRIVNAGKLLDKDPVFIPSGLVDSSQSVAVASQESTEGGLESSAAQLRAMKGKGTARKDEG